MGRVQKDSNDAEDEDVGLDEHAHVRERDHDCDHVHARDGVDFGSRANETRAAADFRYADVWFW